MKEKVVFKLDVQDEKIKKKAMKAVCEFSGVTSLDVKEQGKLKVTGEFDNFEMTKKLKKICKHIDIIAVGPDTEPVQNRNPVTRREPSMPITRPPPPIPHRRPQRVQGQNSDRCIIM